jgi:hypothetical protein
MSFNGNASEAWRKLRIWGDFRFDIVNRLNRLFVSAYKLLGFAILAVVLVGMISYLTISAFYLLSRSWALPSTLTPDAERVLQAQIAVLNQETQLDKLRSEITANRNMIAHIEYAVAEHERFQRAFELAAAKKSKDAQRNLRVFGDILSQYSNIANTPNPDESAIQALEVQFKQNLISEDEFLRLKNSITQSKLTGLTTFERARAIEDKLRELRDLAQFGTKTAYPTSLEGLMLHQPYLESQLAESNFRAQLDPLKESLADKLRVASQHEDALKKIKASPLARAVNGSVHVAFVPYENLRRVKAEMTVRGCYLSFFACRKIGKVKSIVEAESVSKHPITGREMRGRMVELEFDDVAWSTVRTVILGLPPLLI